MPDSVIYIPFPRDLYDDIVRFSEGRFDPVDLAEEQILNLFERNLGDLTDQWFGENMYEFAKRHFPDYADELRRESTAPLREARPLIWKDVVIQHGARVRMQYGGTHHFAKVDNGKIVDDDGKFSPSAWARKTANDTSRNAWRDLWFKNPMSSHWRPAEILRDEAKASPLEDLLK